VSASRPTPIARAVAFGRYAWRLSRLSPTLPAKIGTVKAAIGLLRHARRGLSSPKVNRVELEYNGKRFGIELSSYAELQVVDEVFLRGEYELALPGGPPAVIVDAGSNVGVSVLFFHARYPDALIVAVEPDQRTFERLRVNTDGMECVRSLNVALGSRDERRRFYRTPESWASSLRLPAGPFEEIEVQVRSLASLLDELGITTVDLLKLDIEGGEEEVLQDRPSLERVRAIVGELHPGLVEEPSALLENLGAFDLDVDRSDSSRWLFRGIRIGTT
jgi:FkbM family methyltransferase